MSGYRTIISYDRIRINGHSDAFGYLKNKDPDGIDVRTESHSLSVLARAADMSFAVSSNARTVFVLLAIALHESPRIHVVRPLYIFVIYFVFVFFAVGSLETNATPSRCESLEFLCVVEPTEHPLDRTGRDEIPTLEEIRALADRRNLDAAWEEIQRFLEENPDHIEGRLLSGVFSIWRGETDRAADVFRKLVDDRPDLAEPYNNLAAVYASKKRYQEAEDALKQAISANPSYGIAWENLGDVRIERASLSYQRAGKLYAFEGRSNIEVEAKMGRKFVAIKKIQDEIGYSFHAHGMAGKRLRGEMDVDATAVTGDPDSANADAAPRVESSGVACYSVGPLPDKASFVSITDWFEGNDIFTSTYTRDAQQSNDYEVFIPPSDDLSDPNALIERMQGDGIHDITPISHGDLEQGVMIGVFDAEDAAQRRIDELWEKGHKARYRPRTRLEKQYWIKAYPAVDSSLDKLVFTKRFATHALRTIPCE